MKCNLTIIRVEAFEVTLPIDAPLRHSYGVHEAFTRTIIRVHTSAGLVGLGETAASSADVMAQSKIIIGLDAHELGVIRMRIANRFYWSANPLIVAGIEMACVDIIARAADRPAYEILGGKLRPSISMAAYCFFTYARGDRSAIETPESMVKYTRQLVDEFGYGTIKLKGGVLEPQAEVDVMRHLRQEFPAAQLRFDPNAAWTPATAIKLAPQFEAIDVEYYEDPAPGLAGMSRVKSHTRLQLATNMVVVDFEDLPAAIAQNAVDIVLSDPWYWGGVTRTQLLATVCHTFGLSVGMHSGIELGIGMAAMSHVGVTIPNLTMAVDAHYHHLLDDVIAGPRLLPVDGHLVPSEAPGWGVELDEDKVGKYRELFHEGTYSNLYVEGSSGHGADPERPHWYPVMPSW